MVRMKWSAEQDCPVVSITGRLADTLTRPSPQAHKAGTVFPTRRVRTVGDAGSLTPTPFAPETVTHAAFFTFKRTDGKVQAEKQTREVAMNFTKTNWTCTHTPARAATCRTLPASANPSLRPTATPGGKALGAGRGGLRATAKGTGVWRDAAPPLSLSFHRRCHRRKNPLSSRKMTEPHPTEAGKNLLIQLTNSCPKRTLSL